MTSGPSTTQLLHDARGGDRAAVDRLMPWVYDELRVLARAQLRRQPAHETLNTTALVHEAYLKLTAGETPGWEDRAHFFALAARAMRFVLVSYARERAAQKRGGPERDLPLDALPLGAADGDAATAEAADLLSLDAALGRLAAISERLAEVVELRFFGGMTHEEVAGVTGRSVPTVKRDWRRARAWLYDALRDDAPRAEADAPDTPAGDPLASPIARRE